jgi:predicted outer membrane repeat protein
MTWTRFYSGALAATAAVVAAVGGATAAQAATTAAAQVPCSVTALNSAIVAAPDGGTLVLTPGCVYDTAAPLANIKKNLTIVGSGDTIHLTAAGTILHTYYRNVSISQLTFSGGDGSGPEPGAIHNVGATLSLNNVTFLDNDGGVGGAIQNSYEGTLTITNSDFAYNDAFSGLGGGGGAIANLGGNVSLSGSHFYDNRGASGGAIVNASGGSVWMATGATKTTFTDNVADGTSILNGFGGAIYNHYGSLTLNNAVLNGNYADYDGGAVFTASGTTNITNSGLSGNYADYYGGAIYASRNVNLTGVSVSSNRAGDFGGGLYVNGGHTNLSQNTLVYTNAAGISGGGIYKHNGSVALDTGSSVTLNIPNNCVGTTAC